MTAQETKLIALLSGRKLSDRAIRDSLGCTQGQLIALAEGVRTKFGLACGANLRSFLRSGN